MHHKRGKPKSARSGCLLCKPHKRQGSRRPERAKPSDRIRRDATDAQLKEGAAPTPRLAVRPSVRDVGE